MGAAWLRQNKRKPPGATSKRPGRFSGRGRTEPRFPRESPGLSTAEQDRLDDSDFAFPKQRKEPLVDASHVRNAVARFDQVEGVSDADETRPGAGSGRPPASTTSRFQRTTGGTWPTAARRTEGQLGH